MEAVKSLVLLGE